MAKLEGSYLELGVLCDWIGERIWISLIVLSWERGQIREAGSHSPHPDHHAPTAGDAAVWLPGMAAAAEVVGQSSVIISGLASVCLYLQSLTIFTAML